MIVSPTPELIDALFRDKIEQARATPPEEKLLDGPRLFDYACEIAKAGIRMQHPDVSEDEVERLLIKRLELARRLEEDP
jgi:hypothetical protein